MKVMAIFDDICNDVPEPILKGKILNLSMQGF